MMYFNFHTHIDSNSKFEIINKDETIIESDKFFSYGIHPLKSNVEKLKVDLLTHKNCLAIGECGLDKTINIDLAIQTSCFKTQILLSEKLNLPIIIHCVKATNELIKLKKELNPKQRWIFHGFRKTNTLTELLKNNFIIGIGSAILYDSKLQDCMKSIPIESILLETDNQNKATMECIYSKVAELKNITLQNLILEIEKTFTKTFTKWGNGLNEQL